MPLLLCCSGALITASNTAANSLLQTNSSAALLGRTVSLYMLVMRGGLALGSLLTGLGVGALGVRTSLCIDGAIAMALQALPIRSRRRGAPSSPALP